MDATLYYNPRCATCQKVRAALEEAGINARLVYYLDHPPSIEELDSILKKLGVEPEGIIRKKEPLYQEKYAGKKLSRSQWLEILHQHPSLIERPIVVMGERALVARPPETLKAFLKD